MALTDVTFVVCSGSDVGHCCRCCARRNDLSSHRRQRKSN